MLRRATAVALTLAAAVCLPALAQVWAGRGRAQGVVKDQDGKPIQGATVTLRLDDQTDGPEPVTTNDKGRWATGGLAGGNWTALIEKEGFSAAQGPLHVTEFGAAQPFEVQLVPNPGAAIDVGETLFAAGDYAAARVEYEKAIPHMTPGRAAALRSRIGDSYLAEGNRAAARAEYERALPDITPEGKAHLLLQTANSYQQEENWSAARTHYEQVIPLLPADDQVRILQQIARSYDVEENRAAAIAALERALAIAPENPAVLQLIADLLSREGRDAESEAYLARIPADAELPADMLLNAGIRHYNEGDMETALQHFDRVVRQDPSLADAYYYRGLCHLALQHMDEARVDLQKVIELDADGPLAAQAQEFLGSLGQ
ncbi:MAG: tetratricopeptide repeat protein [Thermoanaerobaculia bacterium]